MPLGAGGVGAGGAGVNSFLISRSSVSISSFVSAIVTRGPVTIFKQSAGGRRTLRPEAVREQTAYLLDEVAPTIDMSLDAPGSRVSMIIRLVGVFLLVLGAALTYFTYNEAAAADLVPQIVPVFYLGAGLLMVVGIVAVIAKYK